MRLPGLHLYATLGIALVFLSLAALAIGPVPLGVGEVIEGLLGTGPETHQLIVREIRLPRVMLAWLVGAALGMAGAALQGLLRNPLAEPGILGISASASLGAVMTLYFGLTLLSPWVLPIAAMLFAWVATLLLWGLTRAGADQLTLILAGIALSSFASALTSLALNFAPNPTDAQDIVLWLLGSLADKGLTELWFGLPFVLVGLGLLSSCASALDLLTLGEEEAHSLGLNLRRLRARVVLGAALCVGPTVAVTGTIGFVGLVVPHLLRPWVGFRPGALLPVSALGGALLVLAADLAVRLVPTAREPMLGVITALIGLPFFLSLLLGRRQSWD